MDLGMPTRAARPRAPRPALTEPSCLQLDSGGGQGTYQMIDFLHDRQFAELAKNGSLHSLTYRSVFDGRNISKEQCVRESEIFVPIPPPVFDEAELQEHAADPFAGLMQLPATHTPLWPTGGPGPSSPTADPVVREPPPTEQKEKRARRTIWCARPLSTALHQCHPPACSHRHSHTSTFIGLTMCGVVCCAELCEAVTIQFDEGNLVYTQDGKISDYPVGSWQHQLLLACSMDHCGCRSHSMNA